MAKWAETEQALNDVFKISDMNDPREKLHIFFRSHDDSEFIHSIVTLEVDPESFRNEPVELMILAVYREYQEGGVYHDPEHSFDWNMLEADKLVASNIKTGYEILTAFVAPEDFDFIY